MDTVSTRVALRLLIILAHSQLGCFAKALCPGRVPRGGFQDFDACNIQPWMYIFDTHQDDVREEMLPPTIGAREGREATKSSVETWFAKLSGASVIRTSFSDPSTTQR